MLISISIYDFFYNYMETTTNSQYIRHGVVPHKLQQGKLLKNIILGGQDGLVNVLIICKVIFAVFEFF